MSSVIEKEKLLHIENIDKSIRWLMENDQWDEIRQIILDGVVNLAAHYKRKI